jgi:RHH-type transcriptional regulator, rel operon repressor / antitoxin RelB
MLNMLNGGRTMLGVRLEPETEERLRLLAEATGRSKSELAREAIRRYLQERDLAAEARRQSLAVASPHEEEALQFLEDVASTEGWT